MPTGFSSDSAVTMRRPRRVALHAPVQRVDEGLGLPMARGCPARCRPARCPARGRPRPRCCRELRHACLRFRGCGAVLRRHEISVDEMQARAASQRASSPDALAKASRTSARSTAGSAASRGDCGTRAAWAAARDRRAPCRSASAMRSWRVRRCSTWRFSRAAAAKAVRASAARPTIQRACHLADVSPVACVGNHRQRLVSVRAVLSRPVSVCSRASWTQQLARRSM